MRHLKQPESKRTVQKALVEAWREAHCSFLALPFPINTFEDPIDLLNGLDTLGGLVGAVYMARTRTGGMAGLCRVEAKINADDFTIIGHRGTQLPSWHPGDWFDGIVVGYAGQEPVNLSTRALSGDKMEHGVEYVCGDKIWHGSGVIDITMAGLLDADAERSCMNTL